MGTVWFCLVALMLTVYIVLDGFDLGAGVVQLFVAHNEEERRLECRTIGPVWDAKEVWLIAAGGTLFFAKRRDFRRAFGTRDGYAELSASLETTGLSSPHEVFPH